jgi:hypothetical protein
VYFLHIARSFTLASRAPTIVHTPPGLARIHTTTMSRCCPVGAQTAKNVGALRRRVVHPQRNRGIQSLDDVKGRQPAT